MTKLPWRLLLSIGMIVTSAAPSQAQEQKPDLSSMSIEDLMNIQVTSVSKRQEPLTQAPAAIYVIMEEDIRRSGSTSIPDLLRMVPGLEVAQINSHTWAISARGFNGRFSNKLLVLIDGRTVYSPLFSGVYWDAQGVPLDDIDRIEVIRGPGAALWGANAVNGIISIITKRPRDTQGGSLTVRGGNIDQASADLQFGGAIGAAAFYRVYARYSKQNQFDLAGGGRAGDPWQMGRGGFRVDWDRSGADSLTVQGDFDVEREEEQLLKLVSFAPPDAQVVLNEAKNAEGNLLARWNHRLNGGSRLSLQFYFDRSNRNDLSIGENRNTYDVDIQHALALGERHDFIWGLGYRFTSDAIGERFGETFTSLRRGDQLFTAFVQDEIKMAGKRLSLTLGSKFEHNDYTGFEIQPNARLMWTINPRNGIWTSISRAVRTPYRAEDDVQSSLLAVPTPNALPAFVTVFGNEDFRSEALMAYEAGYRVQPLKTLSVDLTGYFNHYIRLQTAEPGSPFVVTDSASPRLIIPLTFANDMYGNSHGLEVFANWSVRPKWRLSPGYTWLRENLKLQPGSLAFGGPEVAGDVPRNQFQLRSRVDLPNHLELDNALYYVSPLPAQNVPRYSRFDARFAWHPSPSLELSATVQNAFSSRHAEFLRNELGGLETVVPRSAYAQIRWKFAGK